ncbi:flagellar hook-associated protein FliD [Borrelia miyamotoi]|uniref:Flagellar hook-associated protein 2 n=1 Tax=Borrelia miyamotoi TaxID=47466 RepID=A0AAP8YS16_9SPIR|nr:flagellar filament capping protein FliD [Borrelia miyamotoi]AHH05269.1 Flagellar hook-associated protein 2 [Borrelia miyamotoi FR64b]ATQ15036.1 flagellar filament capping protein FliD [Borrelia miyamotoi]ATQ16219.1 flagellar filament capping protein FliD [Borrelia miyamotoi]ATQ17364.1 flagellar filament capping protein FliD [Borrelia miyamotoi]ATQ18134.1 flagellar filament capping protein FliD [Borrelia miyamotoi]
MSSGFFVPGVDSKYNTKEIRESMLKSDKAKVDSSVEKLESLEQEKYAWQMINKKLSTLNSLARQITSFNSPFNYMSGNSSNDNVLSISARYGAKNEAYKINVNQTAGSDIFLSENFKQKEISIPEGNYVFLVGNKEIKVRNNGDVESLVKDINNRGKGFLSAKIVKSDSSGNSRLVLQSLKEGEDNKLVMKGEALKLAKQIGILSELTTNFSPNLTEIINNQQNSSNKIYLDGDNIVLEPLSEIMISIPENIEISSRSKIKFEIKYYDTDSKGVLDKIIFNPGYATFEDAKVESEDSIIYLESDHKVPLKEKRYVQMNMVKINSNTGSLELPPINVASDFEKVEVEIGSLLDLKEINIENIANDKVCIIRNIEIFDPKNRDGYLPINAKSFAENAKIKFDGVDVERDSNIINDLIPNVTLNLKQSSDDAIVAKVEPDYDGIKKLLLDFLVAYNEVLAEINIVSSNESNLEGQKSDILKEWSYLSNDEKEKAYKNLGILRAEFALKNLKSRLESIMFNAYRTNDPDFSIINQIGVFTNSMSSSGGLSRYLQLDEKKFDDIIRSNINSVKELFAVDFNDDRIYDDGLAKMLGDYLSPLVSSGGFIYDKIKSYDLRISNQKNVVEDYRRKYEERGKKVEGELNTLDFTVKKMKEQENILKSLNFQRQNR